MIYNAAREAASDFGDRYTKEVALGVGGMGEIWEGRDTRLGRNVAIKVIRRDLQSDPVEAERRFRREAKILARLNHPGIPAIHDFGSQDGDLYLVMELVPHASGLQHLITERHPDRVPVPWVAAIGAQVCAAVSAAHTAGLVHRDLKPANIVLGREGRVTVLDFGVATAIGDDTDLSKITTGGATPGTAFYCAPELAEEDTRPDARSDLYGLGCVLYELLAGHRVFESRTPADEFVRHLTEPPPPLARADVPDALAGLVLALLAKDPAHRPAGAAEVFAGLLPHVRDLPPLPGFVNRPDSAPDPVRLYAEVVARL
ncbi:serine/threonine-protein kinase [Spirillospora sp. CA-253888]